MLQQRKVVSVGEYRQIHRFVKPVKPSNCSIFVNLVLGIVAIACFLMGSVLAFGQ